MATTPDLPQWVRRLAPDEVHLKAFNIRFPPAEGHWLAVNIVPEGQAVLEWGALQGSAASGATFFEWRHQSWFEAFKMYVKATAKGCGDRGVTLEEVQDMLRFARLICHR